MKKLVATTIIGLMLVPWPMWGVPVLGPYLRGVISPEEIEFMAPLMMGIVVYPLLGLLALVTLGSIEYLERQAIKRARHGRMPLAHDHAAQLPAAKRRKYERDRLRAKHRAQQEGALLITLAMLGDDKK